LPEQVSRLRKREAVKLCIGTDILALVLANVLALHLN
jgi:hypothetical protein